jgi:hypothetical protein
MSAKPNALLFIPRSCPFSAFCWLNGELLFYVCNIADKVG